MQVLLVCLVLFFVASELYQWLQGMTLPLPMLVVAGVALAIASNLRSLSVPSGKANPPQVFAQAMPNPVVPNPVVPNPVVPNLVVPNPVASKPSVQLPDFISQTQPVSVAKPVVESRTREWGDRHAKDGEV